MRTRHAWDITPRQAVQLQRELAGRVRVEPIAREVRTVAGTDCAFLGGGRQILTVAVLCDAATWEVVQTVEVVQECRFPYVPGLLSFREAPSVIEAVGRLARAADLLMCDGQGLAHPRGLGLASHVGLWLDLPTIGVAKSRLCGEHEPPLPARGSREPLEHGGCVVGAVLRTRASVKPLYVSVGHRVTLEEAVQWTLRAATRYRLPEPTRQAHLAVTRYKARLA